jgi:hypothetical protein
MVVDGRMPKPKRIDRRVIWDRQELDQAFEGVDQLTRPPPEDKNSWDEILR